VGELASLGAVGDVERAEDGPQVELDGLPGHPESASDNAVGGVGVEIEAEHEESDIVVVAPDCAQELEQTLRVVHVVENDHIRARVKDRCGQSNWTPASSAGITSVRLGAGR